MTKESKIHNLSKILIKEAQSKGACLDGYECLKKATDKATMLDLYFQYIDFCLSQNFPSHTILREHFQGTMEERGLFLDEKINLFNFRYCVALGKTTGEVTVAGYSVSEIFAKNTSVLQVFVRDCAFVEIDLFDCAILTINAEDEARVHINRYGGTLILNESQNARIKVTEKKQSTY